MTRRRRRRAYLDHAATTPLRPEALEAMLPLLTDGFANPSGAHAESRRARGRPRRRPRPDGRAARGRPRARSSSPRAAPRPTTWPSTAAGRPWPTAVATDRRPSCARPWSTTPCCAACRALAARTGAELREVPSGPDGLVDLDALAEACRADVGLVSVMAVNNEIGTVQPLDDGGPDRGRQVARARCSTPTPSRPCRGSTSARVDRAGRPGVGQRPQVRRPQGGRRARGRARAPGVRPRIDGGGQERGRRSGTPNVAGVVGMAAALAATVAGRAGDGGPGGRPARPAGRRAAGRRCPVRSRPATAATGWPGILHLRIAGVEAEAAGGAARRGRGGRVGRGGLLERRRRAEPRAGGDGPRPRRGARRGSASRSGVTTTERGCRPCAGRRSRRRRPPARLSPCASWWPCPAESTRRWPPRSLVERLGPDRWWAPPSSCGAATRTRAAARWPTWTTPDGWPTSSASSTTSSTSAAEFEAQVVDPYVAGHAEGRTPNPCIECNRHLKFDRLLDRAAGPRVRRRGHRPPRPGRPGPPTARWRLLRGADPAKDQSYVLAMLGQDQLARTLFPVGEMTKDEVRAEAAPARAAHRGQAGQPGRLLHPLRRGPGRVPGRPGAAAPGPPGRPRLGGRPRRGRRPSSWSPSASGGGWATAPTVGAGS